MYDFGQQFSNSFMNMYQFNQQRKLDKERMDMERQRLSFDEQRLGMAKSEHEQNMLNMGLQYRMSEVELEDAKKQQQFRADNPVYADITPYDGNNTQTALDPILAQYYQQFFATDIQKFNQYTGKYETARVYNWEAPNFINMSNAMADLRNNEETRKLRAKELADAKAYQQGSLGIEQEQLNLNKQKDKTEQLKVIDTSMSSMFTDGSLKSPTLLSIAYQLPDGVAKNKALNIAFDLARIEAKEIADTEGIDIEIPFNKIKTLARNVVQDKVKTTYELQKGQSPVDNAVRQGRNK